MIDRAFALGVELQWLRRIFRLRRVEHISLLTDGDLRLQPRGFEIVIAFLEHLPEREVRIVAMLGHVQCRHAERKGLQLERILAAEKRLARQGIDFLDLLVGHGVTAARRTIAMDHQFGAGVAPGAVIAVGKSGVESEVVIGGRVHLAGRDRIEALRRLAVAFALLGAEIARPAADRIGLEQRVLAVAVLFPNLHFRFFLEDAGEDRRVLVHVLGRDFGKCLFGERRLGAPVGRDVAGIAAGKRHGAGNGQHIGQVHLTNEGLRI